MNKARKGLLMGASITTIVASAFAIIGSLFLFIMGAVFNETVMKESYLSDIEYTYFEEADGSYYFTTIEDGVEIVINEEDIEMVAEIFSTMFSVSGVFSLGMGIAKLILAIRLLVKTVKNEYAKGNVIALLVLSALNLNLIEAALLIVAMCMKDNKPQDENKDQINNSDIVLKDIDVE